MVESNGPLNRLTGSTKVWLTMLGILINAAIFLFSKRPWPETLAMMGSVTGGIAALVAAISREDAASKSTPSTLAVGHAENVEVQSQKSATEPVTTDVEAP